MSVTRPLPTGDEACVMVEGPWRHREITANGQRFHAVEAGEGPLVLLLHGFPQFWWSWRHVIPVLADAGFRVVAPDLRGYGASDKPPRGYDLGTLASDVAGMIPALGEHDAMIAGHGWGGLIAWSTAVLHRRRVRRLVTSGTAHPLAMRHAFVANPAQQASIGWSAAAMQIPRAENFLKRNNADAMMRLAKSWAGPNWPDPEAEQRMREAFQLPGVAHCSLGVLPLGLPLDPASGRPPVRPRDATAGLGSGALAARRGRPLRAARDGQCFPQARRRPVRAAAAQRVSATSSPRRRPTWCPPRWWRSPSPTCGPEVRDRDPAGRARNARPRDDFGRPLPYGEPGVERVPDELSLTPAEAVAEAQRYLDEGHPFQAHEVLEASWKAAPAGERGLWRALAQICVGLTHAQRGNTVGATTLLSRGAQGLAEYAGTRPYEIDVDRIAAEAAAWAADVSAVGGLRLVS